MLLKKEKRKKKSLLFSSLQEDHVMGDGYQCVVADGATLENTWLNADHF